MSKKLNLYAQATELSLENAGQWIKDAKLLIENSSFGHASALVRFAYEEIAKAIVCWYVSERIWPIESKIVNDIFQSHIVKTQIILGLSYGIIRARMRRQIERIGKEMPELTDEEIIEAWKVMEDMPTGMEKQRQNAIYINLDWKNKEVVTPKSISESKVRGILRGSEVLLESVRYYVERFPEAEKEKLREYFSSMPKDVWKTGEIPIDWFLKDKKE